MGLHKASLSATYFVVHTNILHQNAKECHNAYTSSNLLIISATRACRPRYQTQSTTALHKDSTIPSLNVASV